MDRRLSDVPASLRYAAMAVVGLTILLFAVGAMATAGNDDQPPAVATETPESARAVATVTSTATIVATPAATPTPPPATPTPTPEPEPTPAPPPPPPPFTPTEAFVALTATTYAGPSSATAPVRQLYQGAKVSLVGMVAGQNWIIGDQDWVPVEQAWERTWYRLDDGSYIYRAFVYFPDGESPLGGGSDRYVIVDVNAQTAWAMDGTRVVRELPITSGKAGFETPFGNFQVIARVGNERMTSERAGITGQAEQYDVQRVLFTQYFAEGGFALHLNYWQPMGVYGSYPTSHGCVGIPLADAQFLWLFGSRGMRVIVRDGGGATPAPAPAPQPPPAAPAVTSTPTPTATPAVTPAATPTSTATSTPTASATPAKTATARP